MTQRNDSGESFRAPWQVFWVAFGVRVLYLTLAHTYRIHPEDDHMLFGEEMGRIARALATGFGFSDPFRGHTGPTAWVGPLYPLILAGVFKLFGVFTAQSAWVILTINSLFSALTARTTWEIAERCFSRNVARWAAWIWALYPAAMQYAVRWVWDTSLTTFLFSWVLVVALRMRSPDPPAIDLRALGPSGTALGADRAQQSGIADLPTGLRFVGTGRSAGLAATELAECLLAAALFLACLGPWTWRNWEVFHRFVPTRGNFGAELYLGNGPGSTGLLMEYDHPIQAPDQLRLYAGMGEIAYSRMRGRSGHGGDPRRSRPVCPKYPQAGLFLLGRRSPPSQPNRMGGVRAQFEFHICQRLWPAGIGFGDTAQVPRPLVSLHGPFC